MRFLDHIKLAGYVGLVLGITIGTIDIIARIIRLWFEWYEFYQTLLISSLLLIIGFVVLALFIELFKKIIKFRISKRRLYSFYIITAIVFAILFYGEIFINKYLHIILPFGVKAVSFVYLLIVLLVYIFLLTKGRNLITKVILFIKTDRIKRLIKNYLFIVIIFVVVSFFIDLYLLNDVTPTFAIKDEVKDYPNILLITLDAVRTDHLSLYGYQLNTTPNLDRFAKDAIIFENAISPSAWTLPSQSSIFTGRYPFRHNAAGIHPKLDNKETTLAEILKVKGYNTAGFTGGGPFLNAKSGTTQGFLIYKDRLDFFEYESSFDSFSIANVIHKVFPNIYRLMFDADGKRTAKEINKDIFRWLDKNKNKQPFFIFVQYYDAPYYNNAPKKIGIKFRKQFTNRSIDLKEVDKIFRRKYETVSEDLIEDLIALYDTGILYTDYHLKKLFDKLNELEILDNTIIIITADHGEEFYEHKGFTHAFTLYEEIIRVPLIIYYPKEFDAKRIKTRTGNINIFSTILDILQIESPKNVDSISLLPLIKGSSYNKEYTYSEILDIWGAEHKAITIGDWKLIETKNAEKRAPPGLYNLKEDPGEQTNLYNQNVEKRELLRKYIDEIVKRI